MYRTLHACRGTAALIVVLFHLGQIISLIGNFGAPWMARPFAFGHSSVEFFLVLSGFIITHAHWDDINQPARLWVYLKKRFARIYPVYWVVFIGVVLAALPLPALRDVLPTDAWVLVKSLLILPRDRFSPAGEGGHVLLVAWTLQYEVIFYSMMALFILNRIAGLVVLAMLAVMYLFQPFGDSFPFDFLQSNWIVLFFVGVIVAVINRSSIRLARPLILAGVGFLLIFFNGIREVIDPAVEATHFLLGWAKPDPIYGLASALIVLGLGRAETAGQVNMSKSSFFLLLGDASYSLYLIHFPLISAICKIAVAVGLKGVFGAIITFFVALAASLIVSIIFHLRVEKPLLLRMKPWVLGRDEIRTKAAVQL